MNHRNIVEHEADIPYRWRRANLIGRMDPSHTDIGLVGYCLDALDELPAGAMHSDAESNYFGRGWPRPVRYERGLSLRDTLNRDVIAGQLIDEILEEERLSKLTLPARQKV